MKRIIIILLSIICTVYSISCRKLVEIDPPTNTITTSETFKDSSNASSAIVGLYSSMAIGNITLMNGSMTIKGGESADELIPFNSSDDFFSNTLLSSNADSYSFFWQPAYQFIYQANSIIESVQASHGISDKTKSQFVGEAKFLRSLYYFYLINLYGAVPYLTSTDYHVNSIAARTPKDQIYQQIINDLKESQTDLYSDYSISGGDRIRATKWAATALLARVYLYLKDWKDAEIQATSLINNTSLFNLCLDLNNVFLPHGFVNNEAILQWQLNTQSGINNSTPEGYTFIPYDPPNNNPNFFLSDQLMNAFESGDQRRSAWVDSTVYGGTVYYYPFKFKIGFSQSSPGATPTEYTTVLRLAEQYLIRAEARVNQNNILGAINDLNVIRERSSLSDLSPLLSLGQVLTAVSQERRIELFAEWGHRWLDLKRTGQIDSVMSIAVPLKGQGSTWQSYEQTYPIPLVELKNDPNLTQNPGY